MKRFSLLFAQQKSWLRRRYPAASDTRRKKTVWEPTEIILACTPPMGSVLGWRNPKAVGKRCAASTARRRGGPRRAEGPLTPTLTLPCAELLACTRAACASRTALRSEKACFVCMREEGSCPGHHREECAEDSRTGRPVREDVARIYWNQGYGYQQSYGPGYGGSDYSPHGYYGYGPGYYYRNFTMKRDTQLVELPVDRVEFEESWIEVLGRIGCKSWNS
ncbi:Ap-1 Complex Subunit Sigma-1A [Manis pentadactyla]|nr:Ap-1 Complex Subunit Sigma-1A [Manis pentadactyla]